MVDKPIGDAPKLPPGIPPEALPTPEFLKQVAEIENARKPRLDIEPTIIDKEAIEAHKKEMEALLDKTPTEKPKPITLTYVYDGVCPLDTIPVTTIELDIEGKHFVIALCTKCNKQITIRQVANLCLEDIEKMEQSSGSKSVIK